MVGFDYKEFVETLTEEARKLVPSEFSLSEKDFIIDKVYTCSLRTGKALCSKDDCPFDEEQLQSMIQIIAEWIFHKSIELVRSKVSQSQADEILEYIAYKIFEILIPAFRAKEEINTVLAKIEKIVELDLYIPKTQEDENDLVSDYANQGYNYYPKKEI